MTKQKKSRPKKQRKNPPTRAFQSPVAAVTKEELHFSMMVGAAAASNRMPRQSFASKYQEAVEKGEVDSNKSHLVMSDIPLNHMAFAIMDAFPEKTKNNDEKRQALLWRGIFAYEAVARDPRFQKYTHEENGEFFIEEAIVEALATTPMNAGSEVPVDEIFQLASKLLLEEQPKDGQP